MISNRIFVSAALAMLMLQGAHAQMKKAPSPAGSWGFATDKMGYGCALSGDMTIAPAAGKTHKCDFKAVWACELRMPKAVHTQQSCVVTQNGYDVVVTSKLDTIVKVDPTELMSAMQQRYAADHFLVTINVRGDEMDGLFKSYGQAPVKFRKRLDLVG
jgi:hypothetical protein